MKIINTNHLNTFLIGFCFLAIYTSKAGMNITLALLLIGNIAALTNFQTFKNKILQQPIFIAMYSVFALALIAKMIVPGNLTELATVFRKGGFLLFTPYLTILLLQRNHLTLAKSALMVGAVLAVFYSFYRLTLWPDMSLLRIGSFWDAGRWSELVGFLFVGSLPFVFANTNKKPLMIGLLFLALTLASLFISGGRGAILGVAIVTFGYLLIHNRKILLSGVAVLALLVFSFSNTQPISGLLDRAGSIAEMNHASNSSRTLVWKNGLLFAQHHIENEPIKFAFGTEHKTMHVEFEAFLNTIGSVDEMQKSVSNEMSLRDFHNAYLNNLNKMGIIYLVGYLILLTMLMKFFFNYRHIAPMYAWSGINLLAAYMMFGAVYSNEMEFQTACLFFIISIMIAGCLKANDEIDQHAS